MKTEETIENYFYQYNECDLEILNVTMRIENIQNYYKTDEAKYNLLRSIDYSAVKVQKSPNGDVIIDRIIELDGADIPHQVIKDIKYLREQRIYYEELRETVDYIKRVETITPMEKKFIELRYFQHMSLDWIPGKLFCSRRTMFRVRESALKKADKIFRGRGF